MYKLIFAAAFFVLCSFSLPEERFTSKDSGFSILVPKGYRAEKGTDAMVPVIIYSPKESDTDDFNENINVVNQEFEGDAEAYYQANLLAMQNMMKDFNLLEHGSKTVNGQNAAWFVYSFSYGNNTVKILAYCFAFSGKGYVVTCSATPDSFDKYRKVFTQAAESFRKE